VSEFEILMLDRLRKGFVYLFYGKIKRPTNVNQRAVLIKRLMSIEDIGNLVEIEAPTTRRKY